MRMTVNGTDVDVHPAGSETGRWCEVDGEWIGNFYRYGGGRDEKTWERVGGHWMGWTPDKREVGPAQDRRGIIAILIDASRVARG